MRFIGVIIALLISMLLAYYYVTGGWPGSSNKGNPLERASKQAQIEGAPISNGQEAKQRVEEMLKKQEEAQKKAIEENTR